MCVPAPGVHLQSHHFPLSDALFLFPRTFLTADCSLARTALVVNFQAFARVCSSLPSHPSPAASSSGNYISNKSGSNFFSRRPSSLGSLCFAKTFSDESPMVYRRTRRHRGQQLVLRNSATSMQPQVMEAVPARKGELKRGRRDRHVCVHVGQHYSLTGWQQHRGARNSQSPSREAAVHEVPVE